MFDSHPDMAVPDDSNLVPRFGRARPLRANVGLCERRLPEYMGGHGVPLRQPTQGSVLEEPRTLASELAERYGSSITRRLPPC
jgi:hypothetical protein